MSRKVGRSAALAAAMGLVVAVGCQRSVPPAAAAKSATAPTPQSVAAPPPTAQPSQPAAEKPVASATRDGKPKTFFGRVQSMTEGAFPSGMDGKAYLLFSPAWSGRWIGEDGNTASVAPNSEGVVALSARVATEQKYKDLQVHLEFRVPPVGEEEPAARAEILLHGVYGIILTDSMHRPQRNNGCGAISGRTAPEAPACFPPGAWQTMDIAFRAPRAAVEGTAAQPARVTILHNGVLVQNSVDIAAPTEIDAPSEQPERAPLVLAPRAGQMELRNLWVRSLDAGLLPPKS